MTFEDRVAKTIKEHWQHPEDVRMIEHPGYEPYVKIKCEMCGAETYVRRGDETE
jgi:hypothetical protein